MKAASFHSVSDDSFNTRGFPWAERIPRGLELVKICYACAKDGRRIERPVGEVEVLLQQGKGVRWPDVLGCGAWPLFIVSRRVLVDWANAGVQGVVAHPVRIMDPIPKKLRGAPVPDYVWLDGCKMHGANLDFEASGFVDVRFCEECGTRLQDSQATYDRQHSGTWPMVIVGGSWNGADVFTTDLSPAAFFCTEKVVRCAKEHKHTNVKFIAADVALSL